MAVRPESGEPRSLVKQLDADSRSALELAAGLTVTRQHYAVDIEHCLIMLCRVSDFADNLTQAGIDIRALVSDLEASLSTPFSPATQGLQCFLRQLSTCSPRRRKLQNWSLLMALSAPDTCCHLWSTIRNFQTIWVLLPPRNTNMNSRAIASLFIADSTVSAGSTRLPPISLPICLARAALEWGTFTLSNATFCRQ